MMMNTRYDNVELVALEHALHQAALTEKAKIDALPIDISVEDESVLIEAASAPVLVIVDWIESLPLNAAIEIKAKAAAWLNGTYWALYGNTAVC